VLRFLFAETVAGLVLVRLTKRPALAHEGRTYVGAEECNRLGLAE